MGYTHYWTQTRNLTEEDWEQIREDIPEILSYVENLLGVPLADGMGEPRTRPVITKHELRFNGLGDDSHETFSIARKRTRNYPGATLGGDFCKTAHKPYDVAVTACLCYLATCLETPAFRVASDGRGPDFVEGLEAARQALPRKANILDIPREILEEDRWTGPWVSGTPKGFEVRFCVNGKGYVLHKGESYCFDTHADLAKFLDKHKQASFRTGGWTSFGSYGSVEPDIWHATGSFDKERHARIAKAQRYVLARLFPVTDPRRAEPPPAFVRPGELPRPEENGTFCYSLADLLNRVNAEA